MASHCVIYIGRVEPENEAGPVHATRIKSRGYEPKLCPSANRIKNIKGLLG